MRRLSDYNDKKLCECFDCFKTQNPEQDITQINVELTDLSEPLSVILERGKFLSYFNTRFAKIDTNGTIHVFKDYMR